MSTKFFDRNKKKSLLGLLFLWIKENRTLSALLLIVVLSTSIFVAPATMFLNLPGGTKLVAGIAWVASRLGVDTAKWGFFAKGGARSYDDFIAQLRAAKESGSRPVGWGPFFGKPADGAGKTSLDMVKGRRQDLEGGGYAGGKLPQGRDVSGILTPDDSKEGEQGVSIDDALLAQQRGGLVRDANAGGFAPGARDLLGFMGRADGGVPGGAYAGKGMFGGGTGAGSRPGDNIRNAMSTTGKIDVPKSRIQGASPGRLSQARASLMSARVQRGIGTNAINSHRAFAQLADGRGRAALATTPNCVPPGCPGEFATYNTGAIYDGLRVNGGNTDILSAPEIDHATPNVPNSNVADGYMQEAAQMEKDAAECRKADADYKDAENEAMAKMQHESDVFNQMGCAQFAGGGGCSKKTADKARRCGKQGGRINAACADYAAIRNAHTAACPLTRGKSDARMDCAKSSRTPTGTGSEEYRRDNAAYTTQGGNSVVP